MTEKQPENAQAVKPAATPKAETAPIENTRSRTADVLRRAHFAALWLLRAMRYAPVSLFMLVVLWALHFAFNHDSHHMWHALGIGLPYHITDWHILTAGLTTGSHFGSVASTLGILLLAVPAEVVLGSKRFALTGVVMYLITTPLALLAATGLEYTVLNYWGSDLRLSTFLSPSGWIAGTIAVASAFMPVLWRRRTRMIVISLLVTMLLFTGTLSDLAAVAALIVGLPLGVLWRRRTGKPAAHRVASLRETRILVALALFFIVLGPVIAGINPHAQGVFAETTNWIWQPSVSAEQVEYFCEVDPASTACLDAEQSQRQTGFGPLVANLIPLLLTAVVSFGLARGRRLAWWLALIIQLASIAVILLQIDFSVTEETSIAFYGLTVVQLVLPWLLAIGLLLFTRRLFFVNIDRQKIGWSAGLIAAALAATASLWVFGTLAVAGSFRPSATFALAVSELPNRYLPPVLALISTHHVFPAGSFAWFLYEWTGNIFWIAVAVVLYRLLMSVANPSNRADRAHARELLKSGTGDHLSWMTLWAGNRYWFAPDDAGVVAYRVHNGIAVTVGEPIVAAGATSTDLADAFEVYATSQGWQTAWYSVREDFANSRASSGYKSVHVAEESILLCDDEAIAFKGKKFQNIRTARNRAGKEGIGLVWATWAELDPELREGIVSLSEEWVSEKALPEMGFTLGSIAEMKDPDTMLLLAVDEDKRIHGITSWLPVYENGSLAGYTLDVMRRDAEGFRPVIEYLLAEAAIKGNELGLKFVSLSGAPLAPSQSKEMAGLLDATLDKVGETMEPLYGFRSLAASKYKFHPQHQGWYMAYNDELALPAIGLAVSSCYLPQLKARDAVNAVRLWANAQRAEG